MSFRRSPGRISLAALAILAASCAGGSVTDDSGAAGRGGAAGGANGGGPGGSGGMVGSGGGGAGAAGGAGGRWRRPAAGPAAARARQVAGPAAASVWPAPVDGAVRPAAPVAEAARREAPLAAAARRAASAEDPAEREPEEPSAARPEELARAAPAAVVNPTACSSGTAQSGDVTVSLSSLQQKISGFGVSSAWAGSYANASDPDYLWSTTKGAGLTLLRIRYGDGLSIAKSAAQNGVTVWMTPWGTGTERRDRRQLHHHSNQPQRLHRQHARAHEPAGLGRALSSPGCRTRRPRGCRSTPCPPRTSRTAAASTARPPTLLRSWPHGSTSSAPPWPPSM